MRTRLNNRTSLIFGGWGKLECSKVLLCCATTSNEDNGCSMHGGPAILRVSHSNNRRIYHRGHRRVSFIQKKKEKKHALSNVSRPITVRWAVLRPLRGRVKED